MRVEWKLPCPICGGRDVEIVAAWPSDDHPQGHSHDTVTVHWNGDQCHHARRRVELAATPPADPRRLQLLMLGPARAAAERRRRMAG